MNKYWCNSNLNKVKISTSKLKSFSNNLLVIWFPTSLFNLYHPLNIYINIYKSNVLFIFAACIIKSSVFIAILLIASTLFILLSQIIFLIKVKDVCCSSSKQFVPKSKL